MVLNNYDGGETEDGSGEKAGRGADDISFSFDWRYLLEGLSKVKL